MKTVILAGGLGTRLSELTDKIPKPMAKIGSMPIIEHIINIYLNYGFNDFIISSGYKSEVIKNYFENYSLDKVDIKINNLKKKTTVHKKYKDNVNINIVNTGLHTGTAGRIKKLKKYLKNEQEFFVTYGDGLSDINIKKLYNFHRKHGKICTLSAVRPLARFGELKIKKNKVLSFKEKPQFTQGWINGGFFVLSNEIFKYLKKDKEMFERKPIEMLAKNGNLYSFKHNGFWQCMDNMRDLNHLNNLYNNNKAPWIIKKKL